MNGLEPRHDLEFFIDKKDPEILNLWMAWDKGDCSVVGLLEILLHQEIKKHKKENGDYYDRDYDKIALKYGQSIPAKMTHEEIHDLDKNYGIDAVEEISKILRNEIASNFIISEETLKKSGWVEWKNPYTNKNTWATHRIVDGVFGTFPSYLFEYDLETNTFRYNGGEFSTIIKNGFTGNIIDLNIIVKLLS